MPKRTDRWDFPHLVPWLIYAVLYVCLIYLSFQDNLEVGYPPAVIAFSIACSALNLLGMVLFAFRIETPEVRRWAKLIYPVVLFELALGLAMDALIPKNFNLMHDGVSWVVAAVLAVVCVSPAYYAGYRLSYAKQGYAEKPAA